MASNSTCAAYLYNITSSLFWVQFSSNKLLYKVFYRNMKFLVTLLIGLIAEWEQVLTAHVITLQYFDVTMCVVST